MTLEKHFDSAFASRLALREKQIQQSYRPTIGIHKWFARRPGTLFRSLLLAEFNGADPLGWSFWNGHELRGVIADPFMGGGTTICEANRLGFQVIGADVNPMAYWIVRQSLLPLDLADFVRTGEAVSATIEQDLGDMTMTTCIHCDRVVPVKYWLWVKVQACPKCGTENDLFPGYLLAESVRHPKNVVACRDCGALNEYVDVPTRERPAPCQDCGLSVFVEGTAARQQVTCRACNVPFAYPAATPQAPPKHRMWAIEYHCSACRPGREGRLFKKPDERDMARFAAAEQRLESLRHELEFPDEEVPAGDETDRLRRWGYKRYTDMFNARQLLGLGLLLRDLRSIPNRDVRHALLTVFSDFVRYQNLLCRYDTYALKCQDIFSVHGFPVGLIQCENALVGTPRVGSGSFRHFIQKYRRAKLYCESPFETRHTKAGKEIVSVAGESIGARLVDSFPSDDGRQAWLSALPAIEIALPPNSLDGVFTDPPYFDNVQYAELMDFCYVWLRLALATEFPQFESSSTRSASELTGNTTRGRGLEHFTEGLSEVFCHYAQALKPSAPFVFTFHHNDPAAYVPLVVAILDAGMDCMATIPAAAEMAASLHIRGTTSSVVDSVFVCRRRVASATSLDLAASLAADVAQMTEAGLKVRAGDVRCLGAGHLARFAINRMSAQWLATAPLKDRISAATRAIAEVSELTSLDDIVTTLLPEQTAGKTLAPAV